jgi:hypothetical protein
VCTGVPVDCSALDNECNEGVCNETTGACEADPLPDETPCDDGLFCTSFSGSEGGDGCLNGECVGNPVDCGDPYACTDDSCDEDADECVNAPNDGNCTGDPLRSWCRSDLRSG